MSQIETIKTKFPLFSEIILETCEERSRVEKIDAYQIFLDLEEILGAKEALKLLQTYTSESLDALEEIEDEESENDE